ncbi:MAG: DUF4364 family protein [Lachnospiraceae bacterium]|nr:DUF4364 family protein [Lachnospiraceae bacterium]
MTDTQTLYKLILLYMLRRVTYPLSNTQLMSFLIDQKYTDYFHVQEAINDLEDAHLISREKIRNTSQYSATAEGEQTLEYFVSDIPAEIRADVDAYLKRNAYDIRNESCVRADYDRTESGDYAVHCQVREGAETVIDLTLTVPTEDMAATVCSKWPDKSSEIYLSLMNAFFKK